MEIPIAWILSTILGLAGVIGTLSGVMWGFMKSRLESQDKIIESQGNTIKALQDDIERISKGCGADGCVWKNR